MRPLAVFRTGLSYLVAALTALVLAPIAALLGVITPRSRAIDRIMATWCRITLTAAGCPVRVVGSDRIGDGPYLLVGNHASNLDILVLLAGLDLPVRFVATGSLFRIPVMGAFMRAVGMIEPVHRGRPADRPGLVEQARGVLSTGRSVFIFPEGGRSRSGHLGPFRKGTFTLAVTLGLPVVPVTIRGTFAAWPPGTGVVRSVPVEIVLGEPLGVATRSDITALRNTARQRIASGLDTTP